MKALTICQPYSELILRGEKRVENRKRFFSHRGPLLIHAGKSRDWLQLHRPYTEAGYPQIVEDRPSGIGLDEMVFGAIVGRAMLVDCVHIDNVMSGALDERFPWLRAHRHASGPWCLILDAVERLPSPIPYRGELGLFTVPDEVIRP